MAKKLVKYCVVDAFTETAFKGNPAAMCLLEWRKRKMINGCNLLLPSSIYLKLTCYLTPLNQPTKHQPHSWFTPVDEILLPSVEAVAECQPQIDQIQNCPGRGIIITGPAPHGSGFDFYSRFFCPKLGINEDPVCGSAHCALAPYWHKKLGKCDFVALAASPRGGVVKLHLNEEKQRVFLRGKAVVVMEGSLLV